MSLSDPVRDRLLSTLERLIAIPSPTGHTSAIAAAVTQELESVGLSVRQTRRGAVHAVIPGAQTSGAKALAVHLDTLGAVVSGFTDEGFLTLTPVGTWSARFAEGARVTIHGRSTVRGTVLPPKASGHIHDEAVDRAPIGWRELRLRPDVDATTPDELRAAGIRVGDSVGFDPRFEIVDDWVVSRHLDDKAGVAALLEAARMLDGEPPTDIHLWFTVFEEVGTGATALLAPEVEEFVAVDLAPVGPGQQSTERTVTIPALDAAGPFDRDLVERLHSLAADHDVVATRDVFHHYRSDTASAVLSGNDVRVALACFGLHASHGYERTHVDSLTGLARLLAAYMSS